MDFSQLFLSTFLDVIVVYAGLPYLLNAIKDDVVDNLSGCVTNIHSFKMEAKNKTKKSHKINFSLSNAFFVGDIYSCGISFGRLGYLGLDCVGKG